jgi:hypothetical protein
LSATTPLRPPGHWSKSELEALGDRVTCKPA